MGIWSIFLPTTPAGPPSLAPLWAAVLVLQVPVLLLIHRFLLRHGTGWIAGFGLRVRPLPKLLGWVGGSVFLCVVTLLAVNVFMQALTKRLGWQSDLQSVVLALQNGSVAVKATIAFTAIVLAPIVEEPLFRGILYQSCRDAGHRWAGLVLTSLIFGVVHGNLPTLLPLSLFGAYQCWLYERTGNLLVCILTHAGFNAVFVLLTLTGISQN